MSKSEFSLIGVLKSNTEQFEKGLNNAQNKNKRFSKNVNKRNNAMKQSFNKLKSTIMAAFAVSTVKKFLSSAIEGYNKQIKREEALLNAVNNRRDVQRDLIKQASDIQAATKGMFGDEEIIKAQSLLAVLDLEADKLKQLTQLTADFAAEQEMGLTEAAKRVVRTIGNGSKTFSRYGAELEKTNSNGENVNIMLSTMGKKLEGTAELMGSEGVTAGQNLAASWGDAKEATGGLLSMFIDTTAEATGLSDALQRSTSIMRDFTDAMNETKKETFKEDTSFFERQKINATLIILKQTAKYSEQGKKVLKRYKELLQKHNDELEKRKKLSKSAFEEQSKRYNEENNNQKEELGLIERLNNKLKDAKEYRDKAVTEDQYKQRNKQVQLIQNEIDRIKNLSTEFSRNNKLIEKYNKLSKNLEKNKPDFKPISSDSKTNVDDPKIVDVPTIEPPDNIKEDSRIDDLKESLLSLDSLTYSLTESFTTFFDSSEKGFKKLGESAKEFANTLAKQLLSKTIMLLLQMIISPQSTAAQSVEKNGFFKTLLGFNQGGITPKKANTGMIVGGNSTIGDRVPILANSREMILNRRQQGNLFKHLNDANSANVNGNVRFEIEGDKLIGVINNRQNKKKSYN
ncbi:MAG: hypothetical protein ACOCUI_00060 [bacterium]